jgi:hypothetical protein
MQQPVSVRYAKSGKMGSTNLEIEQKVLADTSIINDEENQNSSGINSPVEKALEEVTFDTGFFSWLQVLGSFFLFFNSW